jgi:RNA polymerase sigma factor (sigma-70 family)
MSASGNNLPREFLVWSRTEPYFQAWIALFDAHTPSASQLWRPLVDIIEDPLRRTARSTLAALAFNNPETEVATAVQDWHTMMIDRGFAIYDRGHLFFPFGYRVLKNLCLSMGRVRRRCRTTSLPAAVSTVRDSPVDRAGRREQRGRVNAALQLLTPLQRGALYLKYWEDKSSLEIAQILGISRGQVDRMNFNSRAQLRRQFPGD